MTFTARLRLRGKLEPTRGLRRIRRVRRFAVIALASALVAPASAAEPLRIAVASNFRSAFDAVAADFGGELSPAYGSSGLLYAQIVQGRPFDLFLSADLGRPQALVEAGRALPPVVYASGRLALLVADGEPGAAWFSATRRVALANPEVAPYGRAAAEVLAKIDAQPRQVFAMNVSQAFHFGSSGAADGAFVAFAHALARAVPAERYWLVPESWHAPIEQGAVVLLGGNEAGATAFLRHLLSAKVQARIRNLGYL